MQRLARTHVKDCKARIASQQGGRQKETRGRQDRGQRKTEGRHADIMKTNKKGNKKGDRRKKKGDKADTVTHKKGDKTKGDRRDEADAMTKKRETKRRQKITEGRQDGHNDQ